LIVSEKKKRVKDSWQSVWFAHHEGPVVSPP